MEERTGERIDRGRTGEAISLDPDAIGTACRFCMVMFSGAVAEKKSDGAAGDDVQVLDVAQMSCRSLTAPPAACGQSGAGP